MSKAAAAAAAPAAEGAPPKKGKKMLIIVAAALVLVMGAGGAGAYVLMGKKGGKGKEEAEATKKAEKKPTVFTALDPFTVNLADKDRDHYLQIGLTYEVNGKDVEEEVKAQMPLIRSHILLLLTSKTAAELATAQGKARLAGELIAVAREPMGDAHAAGAQGADHGIVNVHFSAFIIQ